MNTERTEKFVNAIACDLEEGGFRQVSGTTLRRTLATAVSAALPLLADTGIPAPQPAELAEQQGVALWRNHGAAIDAKALATATEIALMWGKDRSQFVSRIQVAVIDAMQWMGDSAPPAQGIDLGEIDELLSVWQNNFVSGVRPDKDEPEERALWDRIAYIRDLIGQRDAAPGVGNG